MAPGALCALGLAADGRRKDGKWAYGAVAVAQRSESGTSAAKQRLAECGVVLDFAFDLAWQVAAGDLALDAAFRQAEDRRDAERRKLEEQQRLAAEETEGMSPMGDNAATVDSAATTVTNVTAKGGRGG